MKYPRSLTAFTLAFATPLVLFACGGNDPDADPDPIFGGGGPMDVTVTTDRSSYDADDDVELTLTARNVSDATVTLEFSSSQRYDFQVEDSSGATVWTWSAARGFAQMLGEERVTPGEELTWSETVGTSLQPGEYTAVGTVTTRSGNLVDRASFTVR